MKILGYILAVVGIVIFALGIIGRFKGPPSVLGQFNAANVITVGIGVMVMAILAQLHKK